MLGSRPLGSASLGASAPAVAAASARIFNAATGLRPTGRAFSRAAPTNRNGTDTVECATLTGSNGLLQRATLNAERLDYSPSGTLLGLLVEPASTNYSDGNYSSSSNYGGPIDPDPLGTNLAWRIGAGGNNIYQFDDVVAGLYEFIFYFTATAGAGTTIDFGDDRTPVLATLNVDAGTWTYNGGGAIGGAVSTGPNGFTRASFFASWAAGNVPIQIRNSGGSAQIDVALMSAQTVSDTTRRLTPILTATNAVPVTRGADTASFTLANTATALTFTFDDGSTQAITGLTGGSTYTIPTSLSRSRILTIDDNTGAAVAVARRRPLMLIAS